MLSIASRIPKTKRPGALQPVLPLVPEKLPSTDEEKALFISFELKTRVGQPADGTKYKKYVRKFEEGTPQQWIDLQRDMTEIWTQNSINGGTDRASTVRALIRGESRTAFETALQEACQDDNGNELAMMAAHVMTALEAVRTTVFPHRALEIQRLWMNRRMFKPPELTTRQTAAAINWLNNALPLFPSGTDASKFSDTEIVGLLEWALPPEWRTKFDLDGYVPTLHTKAKLIEACEAIERNEAVVPKSTKTVDTNNKQKKKNGKQHTNGQKNERTNSRSKYFCTEHGPNNSHGTSTCRVLQSKGQGSSSTQSKTRSFSNKGFRKELNLLSQKSSKKKVLDLYASAVKREQAKLAKKSAKRKASESDLSSDGESDSEKSLNMIAQPKTQPKSKSRKKKTTKKRAHRASSKRTETLHEEEEYRKKVQWLKDHGDSDKDEPMPEQAEDESSSEDE